MKLPDVTAITSLDEAKQIIEQFFQLYEKQQEKIILLEKEIALLKSSPKNHSLAHHNKPPQRQHNC